jgi:hypothetical protein
VSFSEIGAPELLEKLSYGIIESIQSIAPGHFKLDICLTSGKKTAIDNKEVAVKTCRNMDVSDLLDLEQVEESSVMMSLFSRFKKSLVYVSNLNCCLLTYLI